MASLGDKPKADFFSLRWLFLVLFFLSYTSDSHAQRQMPVEEQRVAFQSIVEELRTHWGGEAFKTKAMGLSLDHLIQQIDHLIENAQTPEEYLGFHSAVEREALNREQFQQLMIYFATELWDGHVSLYRNTFDLFHIGIQVRAAQGRLFVERVDPRVQQTGRSRAVPKPGDEILEINGRPIQEVAKELMLYSGTGTFESRFHMALEATLYRPHAFYPKPTLDEPIELTFYRVLDDTEIRYDGVSEEPFHGKFSNQYHWMNHQEYYRSFQVARTISPSVDLLDQQFSAEILHSLFLKGLETIRETKGLEAFAIDDIGALINAEWITAVSKEYARIYKRANRPDPEEIYRWGLRQAGRRKSSEFKGYLDHGVIEPIHRLKAMKIHYKGKTFGYLHIPDFDPEPEALDSEVRWLREAVSRMQHCDLVILDVYDNTGGYETYVKELLSLFAADPINTGETNIKLSEYLLNAIAFEPSYRRNRRRMHLGSQMSDGFEEVATDQPMGRFADVIQHQKWVDKLRKLYENGESYTGPVPNLDSGGEGTSSKSGFVLPEDGVKPYEGKVLVLQSRRNFSAGELVPWILSMNDRAVVFGEITSGAANPFYFQRDTITSAELGMIVPFAEQTMNGRYYLENIGSVPHIRRSIRARDIIGGYEQFSVDVLETALGYQSGKTPSRLNDALKREKKPKKSYFQKGEREAFDRIQKKVSVWNRTHSRKTNPVTLKQAWDSLIALIREETKKEKQRSDYFYKGLDFLTIRMPLLLTQKNPLIGAIPSKEGLVHHLEKMREMPDFKSPRTVRSLVIALQRGIEKIPKRVYPVDCRAVLDFKGFSS